MRHLSLLAILSFASLHGAGAQEAPDTGAVFRQMLPAPILFTQSNGNPDGPPDLGGNSEPLAVVGGTLPAFATSGDPISASVSVTGGVPPYSYALVGTSYPTLATVDEFGLAGTYTAGAHDFSVKVTDSDDPPQSVTLEPGWSIAVADPLVVGTMQSTLSVVVNSPTLFDLPGSLGGTAPIVYSIDPVDPRVVVENDKIKVSTTSVGTITGLRVKAVDHHGRTQFSNVFSVNASNPLTPVNQDDETQVQNVTGGNPVKGTSNRIIATAYSGKSGAIEARPSLRIGVGSSATVEYKQELAARKVYVSYYVPSTTLCNNGTPQLKFVNGHPKFMIETSTDGTTWHNHTSTMDRLLVDGGTCGYSGPHIILDDGITSAKYVRLTVVSALQASGTNANVDVFALRLGN